MTFVASDYPEIIGVPKFKIWSRDLFHAHFGPYLIICLVSLTLSPPAKLDVCIFILTRDNREVPKLKSRSRDPFDPNLHFCLVPLRIVLHAKFGVSGFVRYGDMEGDPKFKK